MRVPESFLAQGGSGARRTERRKTTRLRVMIATSSSAQPSESLPSTSPSLASTASWVVLGGFHPKLFSQKYGDAIWNVALASIRVRVPAFDKSVGEIMLAAGVV